MLDTNLTTNCSLHDWWVLQLGDSVKPLSAEHSGKNTFGQQYVKCISL